jgi:hypothetical protein
MCPAIYVSHPCLADVLDPTFESGLVAALRLVDIQCAINPKVEQARLIEIFQSLRTLSTSSRLRPGLRAFLKAHPEAWLCPKTGRRQSASVCCSLPGAGAAASSLKQQARTLLPPVIKRRLADPGFAADLRNCRASSAASKRTRSAPLKTSMPSWNSPRPRQGIINGKLQFQLA